jgi:hypothetical protein
MNIEIEVSFVISFNQRKRMLINARANLSDHSSSVTSELASSASITAAKQRMFPSTLQSERMTNGNSYVYCTKQR